MFLEFHEALPVADDMVGGSGVNVQYAVIPSHVTVENGDRFYAGFESFLQRL